MPTAPGLTCFGDDAEDVFVELETQGGQDLDLAVMSPTCSWPRAALSVALASAMTVLLASSMNGWRGPLSLVVTVGSPRPGR